MPVSSAFIMKSLEIWYFTDAYFYKPELWEGPQHIFLSEILSGRVAITFA